MKTTQELSMLAAMLEMRHKYGFVIKPSGYEVAYRGVVVRSYKRKEDMGAMTQKDFDQYGHECFSWAVDAALEHARMQGIIVSA